MKATIFTPVHTWNKTFLLELYESLKNQTCKDFEWLILLNGGAVNIHSELRNLFKDDDWIRIHETNVTGRIGELKGLCCELASQDSDILIELDFDDFLTPNAVEEVLKAFSNDSVHFVYSDDVQFIGDYKDGKSNLFGSAYGWKYGEFENHKYNISFPTTAEFLRRVESSPDHLRSFRRSSYNKIGGYNRNLKIGDDSELMMRFFIEYGESGFKKIDKVLYLYRVHSNNSSNGSNLNAEIQKQADINYCNFGEKLFLKQAKDRGLMAIDLGGRFGCPEGYTSVDLFDADLTFDLNGNWPLEDNSVGVIRASHVLEHLQDTIHFFNEAHRVLIDGGLLAVEVPSAAHGGQGAFSDPTHIKFFVTRSFDYYTTEHLAKYIRPAYKGRFQNIRLNEYMWENDNVCVISCHMLALKGGEYDNNSWGYKPI